MFSQVIVCIYGFLFVANRTLDSELYPVKDNFLEKKYLFINMHTLLYTPLYTLWWGLNIYVHEYACSNIGINNFLHRMHAHVFSQREAIVSLEAPPQNMGGGRSVDQSSQLFGPHTTNISVT